MPAIKDCILTWKYSKGFKVIALTSLLHWTKLNSFFLTGARHQSPLKVVEETFPLEVGPGMNGPTSDILCWKQQNSSLSLDNHCGYLPTFQINNFVEAFNLELIPVSLLFNCTMDVLGLVNRRRRALQNKLNLSWPFCKNHNSFWFPFPETCHWL